MKINETKRNHIDEGPLDLLTKSGRAQRRANKSGKRTVQKTADNLMQQFAEYLGIQGKKLGNAETDDVIQFLQSKNVDVSDIDDTMPMDKARLKNIFQVKSRNAVLRKRGVSQQPPAPAPSNPAPSGSNQPPAASNPTPSSGKKISAYSQTVQAAKKLSAKEKRRLIAQLQKSLPNP